MVKRARLKKGWGTLKIQKPKGRLRFESYESLRSFLAGKGALNVLTRITDMELIDSRRVGMRITPTEAKDRILMWWNTPMEKPDAITQRPSYVMTYMLKEAIKKRM